MDAASLLSPASSAAAAPLTFPLLPENEAWNRRCDRLAWTFVAIGVALRLLRYLLRYPLWGDELMLAESFLDRDYLGLLQPLESGMCAPVLFLWTELAVVQLGGFSEWTLRLFPLLSGIVGLVVFRYTAARLMRGVPLLIAVAMLALAYYPIRHASEMRPYASDLTVAVLLVAGAVQWLCKPSQSRWLWAMAAFAPLAVGVSYPALFAAGAVSLGLAWSVWKQGNRGVMIAFAAFNAAVLLSFLGFYKLAFGTQFNTSGQMMIGEWYYAFPPLSEPARIPGWLFPKFVGEMMSYPFGGDRCASIITSTCVAVGCYVLCRRKQYVLPIMTASVFVLALIAACLKLYPFAGSRCLQYLGPFVCLPGGIGGGALISWAKKVRTQRHVLIGVNTAFLVIAVGLGSFYVLSPFKHRIDSHHRGFAKWFWEENAVGADLICLQSDEGRYFGTVPNCYYLCNRRIYGPKHDKPAAAIDATTKKLRYVTFRVHTAARNEQEFAAWMKEKESNYVLTDRREHHVHLNIPKMPEMIGIYEIYEFVPKGTAASEIARRSTK